MEQSLSWKTNSCSASQEIPHLLWNPAVQYCVHENLLWSLPWARWIHSIPPTLSPFEIH